MMFIDLPIVPLRLYICKNWPLSLWRHEKMVQSGYRKLLKCSDWFSCEWPTFIINETDLLVGNCAGQNPFVKWQLTSPGDRAWPCQDAGGLSGPTQRVHICGFRTSGRIPGTMHGIHCPEPPFRSLKETSKLPLKDPSNTSYLEYLRGMQTMDIHMPHTAAARHTHAHSPPWRDRRFWQREERLFSKELGKYEFGRTWLPPM